MSHVSNKSGIVFTMILVFLFGTTSFVCVRADLGSDEPASAKEVVIDDGNHNAVAWYDEKTPILDYSTSHRLDAKSALHFKTQMGGDGHSLITKYQWPKPQDLSSLVGRGQITLNLWVNNPEEMQSLLGSGFEFALGSFHKSEKTQVLEGAVVSWIISPRLISPGEWNHLILKIEDGKAVTNRSSVNGHPLDVNQKSGVTNGPVDWSKINYHRYTIFQANSSIEGYIDNPILSSASGK